MDYDFSCLCSDQIEKVEKRLHALNKSFVKEYKIALTVINNHTELENRPEKIAEINDILNDEVGKCLASYAASLNNIQKVLRKYL